MGSAKSAMLLITAHSFEERGIPFLCISPQADTRNGDSVIWSRIGAKRDCVSVIDSDNIYDLIIDYSTVAVEGYLYKAPQWILVDECQFLTTEQVDQLAMVVDRLDINVICYGLRTDFKTKLFDASKRLMELADDIEEMKISCECGRKAIINARIDHDGHVITDGEQVVIGGDDMYKVMCRKCYTEAIIEQQQMRIQNNN